MSASDRAAFGGTPLRRVARHRRYVTVPIQSALVVWGHRRGLRRDVSAQSAPVPARWGPTSERRGVSTLPPSPFGGWPAACDTAAVRIRAVVFDLFITLTDWDAERRRPGLMDDMAAALGVDPLKFSSLMRATFTERVAGRMGDARATFSELARQLGCDPAQPSSTK